MLSHFRLAVFAAAALCGVWAGQASAQWPFREVARLDPGYGGVCEDCDLSGRIMAGARMTNSVFNRSDFSNAVLTRADASRSEFEDANFTEADLTRAKLIGAQCPRAVFAEAILAHSDASRADLAGANLESAVLDHGRFVGTRFTRARFRGARIIGADFSGADMRRVRGLSQAQLSTACGDASTQLPPGLTIPRCEDARE